MQTQIVGLGDSPLALDADTEMTGLNDSSKARKKKKNFLDDLSNSVRPFDHIVKAGNRPAQRLKIKDHHRRNNHAAVSGC